MRRDGLIYAKKGGVRANRWPDICEAEEKVMKRADMNYKDLRLDLCDKAASLCERGITGCERVDS